MLSLLWTVVSNGVLAVLLGVAFVTSTLIGLCVLFAVIVRWQKWSRTAGQRKSIGIFHPYCLSGGGGERVLWAAVRSLATRHPGLDYVIYTGDSLQKCQDFRIHVMDRFKIDIPAKIHIRFIHLPHRTLLESRHYPVLTMIFQSLGSVLVGLEGLWQFNPDVFLDTTGHAFTFPVFRFLGSCRIAAYVHYPTISIDMLAKVRERRATYNNAEALSQSSLLSSVKLIYYQIFAFLYGCCGYLCDVTMVNSTWTFNHIQSLWHRSPQIVYPPCNVAEFLGIKLIPDTSKDVISIVSIGQFRPEKDHALQLQALSGLLFALPHDLKKRVKLDFAGSCRNSEDYKRVEELEKLASKLMVKDQVEFHLNVPFPELLRICQQGTTGIHTMWNEHFGIGVVECMAAGLITVAHDSGGPKADIVNTTPGQRTGFLAHDIASYAKALREVILLDEAESHAIRERARDSVGRFTDEKFDQRFYTAMESLIDSGNVKSN